ncbi:MULTISPECIES: ABC transporter ATP-binding protein [unclassified Nocardioides]|uniref:ABC transporter ATP-binding protein n=1 Tax=unclassified Nocardioides TaxID=2615069 RepID=UPI0006F206B3|nr:MULTISPECIES: ABC transporter ATP-binding protein [unclassified Nocardioides]KRA29924.1 ABC transporter [Nocardioides sp. Root614]KRA86845.1 ABC transporter [Nocardioides sp. Root682]
MLELKGVTVTFDGTRAVDAVDLSVKDGDVLAVLGPSGCGKSTLLRAVAGLEPLVDGSIAWEGQDLAGTPTHRRGFALMFQDGQLFDHLTVARNVGYAQRLRGLSRAAVRAEVDDLLTLVGLEGYADRLPRTLSGGERQRVALARSLAARPRLLLLDEPLSALDAGLRGRLATDLRRILTESGTTALMVTHDQAEAFAVADRLAVMRAGKIVQEGATTQVWGAPVDGDTALFLGYSRVLEGAAAAALLDLAGAPVPPGAAVAVRSSAVQVGPGDGRGGVVRDFQLTPDGSRVVVAVDGVGDLAGVGAPGWAPVPGDVAAVRVDRRGLAVIPDAQAHR